MFTWSLLFIRRSWSLVWTIIPYFRPRLSYLYLLLLLHPLWKGSGSPRRCVPEFSIRSLWTTFFHQLHLLHAPNKSCLNLFSSLPDVDFVSTGAGNFCIFNRFWFLVNPINILCNSFLLLKITSTPFFHTWLLTKGKFRQTTMLLSFWTDFWQAIVADEFCYVYRSNYKQPGGYACYVWRFTEYVWRFTEYVESLSEYWEG